MLELKSYQNAISVVFILTFTYPAYNDLFVKLSPAQQTWFALLLPAIKLIAKNAISPFCKYIEDFKPDGSTSVRTVFLLLVMDFVHAGISLWDVCDLLSRIQRLRTTAAAGNNDSDEVATLPDLLDHVLTLVKADPSLCKATDFRITPRDRTRRMSSAHHVLAVNSVVPGPVVPSTVLPWRQSSRIKSFDVTKVQTTHEPDPVLKSLDAQDRSAYVVAVLKLLHMIEFLVLVEFTEVATPIIYTIYVYITYQLPNCVFHSHLHDMNETQLNRTLSNIMLYSGLELLSVLTLQFLIYRKIRLSPVHQLAFVLEKQWTLVQLKLNVWFLFMIMFSIDHFGVDYSFKFD
ncbi:hypothetical protein Poli38472_005232 [Pythium oligandrum]|uniref:Uncharacterized protein n=1 Tax=Pythium oligandrum TaxID=41045 RepID=A0A8K1CGI2_PYTOL|nr:hypothetical protein Poli38472_005232 [Pythium oligandrum]|eukprot:TMW62614.1 hypothetical protein Poli38472_005232 [Pythium oligandrum]